jgi:hypothetical protein
MSRRNILMGASTKDKRREESDTERENIFIRMDPTMTVIGGITE